MKTKKITGILLSAVALVAMLSILLAVSASGLGTTTIEGVSYYQISTADDLYEFAQIVNGTHPSIAQNTAANAILTADIVVNENVLTADGKLNGDGSNFKVWTPIGNGSGEYAGIFDGNGHTVSGLYFNDSTVYHIGLFGYTSGCTVKNVGVVDSYLSGEDYVGGLAGRFYNSTAVNCYNEGAVSGVNYVGGIAGSARSEALIQYCYNMGKVKCEMYGGGIVGEINNYTEILNCYNHGDVSGSKPLNTCVGGIVGQGATTTLIQYCYSSAKISGRDYVGALIGDRAGGSSSDMYYNSDLHTGNPAGSTSAPIVKEKLVPIPTEQFLTGEVAYKLGMKQNIDNGEIADKFPNFTGAAVYQLKGCDGELTNRFSNNPDKKVCSGGNYDENGYCRNTGCEHEAGILVTEQNYEAFGLTKDHIGYYAISHADQLYWLSQKVESTKNYKVKVVLTADIDLNPGYTFSYSSDIGMVKVLQDETAVAYIGTGLEGTTRGAIYADTSGTLAESQTLSFLRPWTPIGFNNQYYYYQFRGVFDGNCKVVRGMYYNGTANKVGLIGTLYDSSGGLVKNVGVENCCLISNGSPRIGGVVGNLMYGRVENCYTHSGFIGGNGKTIGGVVGYVGGSSSGENRVANCYSNIKAILDTTQVGPIGRALSGAIVENCYYYGSDELDDIDGTTALSSGSYASISEMTYRLNRGVTDGTQVFYYPPSESGYVNWNPCFDKARGKTVYLTSPCPSEYTTDPEHTREHNFASTSNGFCTRCDIGYQEATPVTEENYNTLGLDATYVGYYAIQNGGQLFWFAEHINKVDRTASAVLVADIDLEGKSDGTGRSWTPIGSTGQDSNNFRGVFDGQNHTIKGLYVEGGRAGLGFFGEVRTGIVKNFTIYGDVVVNTDVNYVGGVIGSACGLNSTDHGPERNGATVQNITSYVNLTAKTHGIGMVGGFIGYANHQTLIENCSWYGTFDAGEYRVDSGAGGFIGRIYDTATVTIRNCAAYGTVKTAYKSGTFDNQKTIYIGGFLSFSPSGAQTVLENNLWAGKIINNTDLDAANAHLSAYGTLSSDVSATNCYALDNVPYVTTGNAHTNGILTVTEAQLLTGEVAYKLGSAWGQDIKADETDTEYNATPVLGGATVYKNQLGGCNEASFVYGYANTEQAPVTSHDMADATCEAPKTCKNGCGLTEGDALGHLDENTDHICDRACGKEDVNMDQHLDGEDADHLCDYGCEKIADDGCHDVSNDADHECDECGAENVTEHTDSATDNDHLCDNGCGAVLEDCTPNADDGDCTTDITCSVCGDVIEEGASSHTGGTATCTGKAECTVCGKEYGELVPHSHGSEWKTDESEHWNECECGDKANKAAHVDSDSNGKCDTCDYTMSSGTVDPGTDPVDPGTDPDPQPPVDNPPEDDNDGLGTGAIIGIVVAAVAVIGGGGFALWWFVFRKKSII